jgi:hypothetical protein
MPTARELLEQADALMRRNRKRGKDKHGGPPTLTDALGVDRAGTLAPTIILPDAAPADVDPLVPDARAQADPIVLDTLSDLPVLTDVVNVWPAPASEKLRLHEAGAPANALDEALEADALATTGNPLRGGDESDEAPEAMRAGRDAEATPVRIVDLVEMHDVHPRPHASNDAVSIDAGGDAVPIVEETDVSRGPSPLAMPVDLRATPPEQSPAASKDERANPPAPVLDEEFILDIPPASKGDPNSADATTPPRPAVEEPWPAVVPGSLDWDAMAEEIRMQVLQRLDLFTDTGMRDQLGARLRPIVERASAELVETLNQQLGELVRGYVAEAIEREIESWRKRGS